MVCFSTLTFFVPFHHGGAPICPMAPKRHPFYSIALLCSVFHLLGSIIPMHNPRAWFASSVLRPPFRASSAFLTSLHLLPDTLRCSASLRTTNFVVLLLSLSINRSSTRPFLGHRGVHHSGSVIRPRLTCLLIARHLGRRCHYHSDFPASFYFVLEAAPLRSLE